MRGVRYPWLTLLGFAVLACGPRGAPSYICGPGDSNPICPRLADPSLVIASRVVKVLHHDPDAFTEGLTFARLWENVASAAGYCFCSCCTQPSL